jgi:hypothetical protein
MALVLRMFGSKSLSGIIVFRYFIVSVDQALNIDSPLFSYFVASINRTEDRQPLIVYRGFQIRRRQSLVSEDLDAPPRKK